MANKRLNSTNADAKRTNSQSKRKKCVVEIADKTVTDINLTKIADKRHNNGRIDKNKLNITKGHLITKTGKIKKKSKQNLKLLNDILKSELLIVDNGVTMKRKCREVSLGVNNNNYSEIKKSNASLNNLGTGVNVRPTKRKITQTKPKIQNKKQTRTVNATPVQKKNVRKPRKCQNKLSITSQTKQITITNGLLLPLDVYQCDYCQMKFTKKSSLRRHIYSHLDSMSYSCKYCSRRFRKHYNLSVHVFRKHLQPVRSSGTYICNQCDKTFSLKQSLRRHLATHVQERNRFKCTLCDKTFLHHLPLAKHEKQHVKSGRYQCFICNMSYNNRSRLALHVKSHLNIKDYVCQYCGKEFLRPNCIRRHVEICHDGFRIQCPICFKKLKGHLSEHLRLHDKKRPHKCPDCGQRFTQSTQLTVHRRSHTGAKPYPCRICNRPFSHSNALMLHIRRHTGEKPFQCIMCPLTFSQLPHMKTHMSKIHGKRDTYKCRKCNEFFKLKVQLEVHTKKCVVDNEDNLEQSKGSDAKGTESVMSLSKMRFLLALLLTMISTKEQLKILGFNKRLIDDLLIDSLEAMGHKPFKDETQPPIIRLKSNIEILLIGTIPKDEMSQFRNQKKTTEEILELLTDEKKKD